MDIPDQEQERQEDPNKIIHDSQEKLECKDSEVPISYTQVLLSDYKFSEEEQPNKLNQSKRLIVEEQKRTLD